MSDTVPSPERLHVGLLIHALEGGGAEMVATQWAGRLAASGHRVTAFLFGSAVAPVTVPPGVVVVRPPRWARVGRGALLPLWLRRAVSAERPDVLLSLLDFSNLLAALALTFGARPTRVVLSARNLSILRRPGVSSAQNARLALTRWLSRRLFRRADGFVAISHPVAADSIAHFRIPPERVFVVPNPVLAGRASARVERPAVERLHVAFVGRLSSEKRPHRFLDAVAALREDVPAVRATVFGKGPLDDELRDRIERERLPVTLAGWHPSWTSYEQPIDCLVVTSASEGFGNVLVEAAASGIPAVASSKAIAVADALLPGVTGQLVPTDSPRAFAGGVLAAVAAPSGSDDPRGAWLDRFTVERSTEMLADVLHEVTAGERSAR